MLSCFNLAKASGILKKSMFCHCISSNFVKNENTTGIALLENIVIRGSEAAVGSNEAGSDIVL